LVDLLDEAKRRCKVALLERGKYQLPIAVYISSFLRVRIKEMEFLFVLGLGNRYFALDS
jgi:hypothetical protein